MARHKQFHSDVLSVNDLRSASLRSLIDTLCDIAAGMCEMCLWSATLTR